MAKQNRQKNVLKPRVARLDRFDCNVELLSQVGGDAITEILGLLRKSPDQQTGQPRTIHHMITQLVQREPSDHAKLRRQSVLVHPTTSHAEFIPRRGSQMVHALPSEYTTTRRLSMMESHRQSVLMHPTTSHADFVPRRGSQMVHAIPSEYTTNHRSSMVADRLPSAHLSPVESQVLSTHDRSRRHTLASVPEISNQLPKSSRSVKK